MFSNLHFYLDANAKGTIGPERDSHRELVFTEIAAVDVLKGEVGQIAQLVSRAGPDLRPVTVTSRLARVR